MVFHIPLTNYSFIQDLDNTLHSLIISLLFLAFAVLYKLIFLKLPIQSIRECFLSQKYPTEEKIEFIYTEMQPVGIESKEMEENPCVFMDKCTLESKKIANKMLSHSQAHLFVGCLIAMGGLVLFYFLVENKQFTPDINNVLDNINNVWEGLLRIFISFLPKFGILFFVEYIALFFLRQYKKLQDEYKYYESIIRKRQHKLLILKLMEKSAFDDKTKFIIQNLDKHSAKIFYVNKKAKEESERVYENDLISICADLAKALKK